MQSDCKNYFGLLVEEFSGIQQEFRLMACALFDCWTLCLLETVTDGVVTQEFRERGISVCTSSENVSLQMQNNF